MANNLIDLYQKLLNLSTAKFELITHDDAMVALVYNVTLPDIANAKRNGLKIVRPSIHFAMQNTQDA